MFLIRKSHGPAKASNGAIGRALSRLREQRQRRTARIGFIVDATGSREAGWEEAQTVQGRMFQAVSDIGRVAVRLVHFGGNHMSDHGWNSNAAGLAAAMAAVRCQSGLTQIIPSLQCFVDGDRADAVILVGDAFEEEAVEAFQLLPFLNAAGTRIFAFFEGDNRAAEAVFRRLAEETGGRFARLGEDLPLGDLCEGVALLAAGGSRAVNKLKNDKARQLLLGGPARRAQEENTDAR